MTKILASRIVHKPNYYYKSVTIIVSTNPF